MTAFERIKNLCKSKGITIRKLEQEIGVSQNLSYRWKYTNPSAENLSKLAEYFGVTQEYILTGKDHDTDGYYLDPETARLAEELKNNTELKALFDVARDMTPDRLEAIYNLVKKM